jgi:hypothetical protein
MKTVSQRLYLCSYILLLCISHAQSEIYNENIRSASVYAVSRLCSFTQTGLKYSNPIHSQSHKLRSAFSLIRLLQRFARIRPDRTAQPARGPGPRRLRRRPDAHGGEELDSDSRSHESRFVFSASTCPFFFFFESVRLSFSPASLLCSLSILLFCTRARAGNKHRAVGFTEMNKDSSRSHSIFVVHIETAEKDPANPSENKIRAGKLNLVDLAGSERQSKTQVRRKSVGDLDGRWRVSGVDEVSRRFMVAPR